MPIRTNKLKPFLYYSLIGGGGGGGGGKKPVNARGSLNIHNVYSKFFKNLEHFFFCSQITCGLSML